MVINTNQWLVLFFQLWLRHTKGSIFHKSLNCTMPTKVSERIILQISLQAKLKQASACVCAVCHRVCQKSLACLVNQNSFTSALIHQCSRCPMSMAESVSQHFYCQQARKLNSCSKTQLYSH